jgi:probable F420-dependent oxidoreductase
MSIRVGIGWGSFGSTDVRRDSLFGFVERLEEIGYDSIWVSDSATLGGPAPLITLTAIASHTDKLKLGTNVLVAPPRNAVVLAKELSTLDTISGGRLLPAFGLGVEIGPEAAAMAVAKGERAGRTNEAIEVIRLLWSGEPVTFEGRFTSLQGVVLSPPPIRDGLDIWLGGSSPAALKRTGRLSDGWIGSFVSPAEMVDAIAQINTAAEEAGRSIDDDHFGTTLFAAPSRDQMPAAAARLLELRPELDPADHIAFGAVALRRLIERFVEAGAQKFVVVPIADDVLAWLEELWDGAIAPVQAMPVP